MSHEPTELVVTVRAGTPLAELEAVLAERGQCLPFEPPRFAPGGTVGGMVACGLSGPARPYQGAVRDHLARRADAALSAGIDAADIVLDPGLGFAKNGEDNWALLAVSMEQVHMSRFLIMEA